LWRMALAWFRGPRSMWVLILCAGVMEMGSLWSVLEEREVELAGLAEVQRAAPAETERALARLVDGRGLYRELMGEGRLADQGAVVPLIASGPDGAQEVLERLGEVMRATVGVFEAASGSLDSRTVGIGLGLECTAAQLKRVRARIARLVELGILVPTERGRYRLAGAGAGR
jgi:hypothetical protein